MTKNERKVMVVITVIAAVVVVFCILMAISALRDHQNQPTQPITEPTTITSEVESESASYNDWWEAKEEAAKKNIQGFKLQLKELLKTESFTSTEAKEMIRGLAEAPIDVQRDNFHLSDEEWEYILNFEKAIGLDGDGDVKLSDHLVFHVEETVFQIMYIAITDDSGEGIDYWYLSWD